MRGYDLSKHYLIRWVWHVQRTGIILSLEYSWDLSLIPKPSEYSFTMRAFSETEIAH